MILPIIGLIVGLLIGTYLPVSASMEYAKYLSVALLASLDSVFGALRAGLEGHFDNVVFLSGFFTNSLLAAGFTFLGERIGIDLYYVALLAFGLRVFQNLAVIRHLFIKR